MKLFLIGLTFGIVVGLAGCTPAAAPTLVPTAAPHTATTPPKPTETQPPAATNTTAPKPSATDDPYGDATATSAVAATATNAATATEAASPTPAITNTPQTAFITFQDFEIIPRQTTIKAGTKVVFLIKAGFLGKHQPYSSFPDNIGLSGLFEAPNNLGDGTSWPFTFTQPGTYTIRCGFHPNEMVGTVEVTP
jgi:plastocyanin